MKDIPGEKMIPVSDFISFTVLGLGLLADVLIIAGVVWFLRWKGWM